MSPCRAVLFDMDGVLVNSNPFHLQAWRALTRREGLQLSDAELEYGLGGRISVDILRHFLGPLPAARLQSLAAEKELLFRDAIRGRVRPFPGLHGFLQQLRNHGLRLAVATSAPRANLELMLQELHLEHFFDGHVSAEDVSRGKPDPEVYLLAAAKLGCAAATCAVVEDAVAGIQAGCAAGMRCVGVTSTQPAHVLTAAGAKHTISDFTASELLAWVLADCG
ncbi:MAG: HAD family hydrolase [Terriglobales bacterium]